MSIDGLIRTSSFRSLLQDGPDPTSRGADDSSSARLGLLGELLASGLDVDLCVCIEGLDEVVGDEAADDHRVGDEVEVVGLVVEEEESEEEGKEVWGELRGLSVAREVGQVAVSLLLAKETTVENRVVFRFRPTHRTSSSSGCRTEHLRTGRAEARQSRGSSLR